MAEIESLGGMARAIEAGIPKLRIEESAARIQARIDTGQQTVVGVNRYQSPTPPIEQLQTIDPAQTQRQLDRLARVKRDRDDSAMNASLQNLENIARGTDNTMPAILACVEAYATLGEISDVLRGVFGVQQEFSPF